MDRNKFNPDPRHIAPINFGGGSNLPIIGQTQPEVREFGLFLHKKLTPECTTFTEYLKHLLLGFAPQIPNSRIIQCRPAIMGLWGPDVMEAFHPSKGMRFWNFLPEDLATAEEYGLVVSRIIPVIGEESDSIAPQPTEIPL